MKTILSIVITLIYVSALSQGNETPIEGLPDDLSSQTILLRQRNFLQIFNTQLLAVDVSQAVNKQFEDAVEELTDKYAYKFISVKATATYRDTVYGKQKDIIMSYIESALPTDAKYEFVFIERGWMNRTIHGQFVGGNAYTLMIKNVLTNQLYKFSNYKSYDVYLKLTFKDFTKYVKKIENKKGK